MFAVGGNERAARLSGIPVQWIKISVYGLSGLCAGIAGIVHAGQFSFGSPNDGTGYELNAIAAVVIGGTDLFGGAAAWSAPSPCGDAGPPLANILQLNHRRQRGHAAAGHRGHHRAGRRPADHHQARRQLR